jgi:hypothetical protein
MATKLKKIKVNEVSLVTKPAIAKEFLLFKSEDGQSVEVPDMADEIIKTEETQVEAPVVKEEPVVEAEKPAIDTQKAVEEPVAKEVKCPTCGQKVDEAEAKKMKDGESCKACQDKKVKKDAEDLITKQIEDIQKALEAERVEKAALTAKVAEQEKAAFESKQTEITKAYITKVATELHEIPGTTAQVFGPILKSAADKLEKAEFDVIYEALKSASAFIKANSRLTKELGVGGEDLSADPAAQLDAIAKTYVQKDTKLTYAKAYSIACDNNPQIYAQHVRQVRRD